MIQSIAYTHDMTVVATLDSSCQLSVHPSRKIADLVTYLLLAWVHHRQCVSWMRQRRAPSQWFLAPNMMSQLALVQLSVPVSVLLREALDACPCWR